MERGDLALRVEMAWVAGVLYGSGGLIVALSMLTGPWEGWRPDWMLGVVVVASAVGIGLFVLGARRYALPLPGFIALASVGAVVVAVLVVAGGPLTAGSYGVFYVYVTAFIFYYFPVPLAASVSLFSVATYGLALRMTGGEVVDTRWAVISAASVVAGAALGTRGRHARTLSERQRQVVDDLRELEEIRTGLLSAVSHEVRTPLTLISGYASSLRHHADRLDRAQIAELAERLDANSHRLGRLLEDLLATDAGRGGSSQLRRSFTRLDEFVHRVVSATPLDGHPVSLHADPVVAQVDGARLGRALEHLLGNVVRHTPVGTPVVIEVREVDEDATITVTDSGPGLDATVLSAGPVPFQHGAEARTSASPGLGLGLAFVTSVAQAHGGDVLVDSGPDRGTRVTIRVPRRMAA